MFSDNSGELIRATKAMRINHEGAQLGVPVGNAIAERNNPTIMQTTKAVMEIAGAPTCLWPYAAPTVCLMLDVTDPDTSSDAWESQSAQRTKSAWELTHKHKLHGLLIPFGAEVFFNRQVFG